MFDVLGYWDKRYATGGTSGAGSRGAAAAAKAAYVNDLIKRYDVQTVIDWGCGDGEVARRIKAPYYIGLETSQTALDMCRGWKTEEKREWMLFDGRTQPVLPKADLALSLDVIYHLVDDDLYQRHLALLFGSAPLVCVNSSSWDEKGRAHVLHRAFLKDVPAEFRIIDCPFDTEKVGMWVFRRSS